MALALERDNTVFLYVGRIAREKRLDLLLRAFGRLRDAVDSCSLVIVGDGPTELVSDLKNDAAAIGNVHFTGYLFGSEKGTVFASCDVFCSPSPHETFGRTIVEAMASGLPVISVDSGAAREHIRDGENGHLVAHDDLDGLTTAMRQSLEHRLRATATDAAGIAEEFSVDSSCSNLENLYAELLAPAPVRAA